MESTASQIARQVEQLKVLIVDDEPSMRKVTRALLQAIGVSNIYEASDGSSGLDAICTHAPDVVILDWEMPSPNGPEFVRAVRSPGQLSAARRADHHADRPQRAFARGRSGAGSASTNICSSRCRRRRCLARIVSILAKPRPMTKQGDYYGPRTAHTT